MISSNKAMIFRCFFIQFFVATFDLVKPVMIGLLIKYSGKPEKNIGEGIGLLIMMIMSTTFQSFLSLHADFQFVFKYYYTSIIIIIIKTKIYIYLFRINWDIL